MSDPETSHGRERDKSSQSATDQIGVLLALVASVGVIISFVYDWGFLSELGIEFSDAPTTIADHFRSWLVWLPLVAVAAWFILAQELLLARLERGKTEEEIVGSSRNPAFTRLVRQSPRHSYLIIVVLLGVLWLLYGEPFSAARFVFFPALWIVFVGWVFRQPRLASRFSAFAQLFAALAPAILLLVFFLGALIASGGMSIPSASHRIVLSGEGGDGSNEEVRVLRSFEDWVLVRDANENVVWIHADGIARMQVLEGNGPFRGIACVISDSWCLAAPREE